MSCLLYQPSESTSRMVGLPFYVLKKDDIAFLEEYFSEGRPSDGMGNFITYLFQRSSVHVHILREDPHDIGDLPSYLQAKKIIEGE
ncbi:hypothetical protein HQ545_02660 [Candidatus Woesearchaeota archaeon]|nr:hypothetical protein [Candidatus Woesearchaeota archaeon]